MKITKETIIRTVLLGVALVNLILNAVGKNTLPFTNEEISEGISVAFAVITSLVAWWKNNSFTKSAIAADEYMNEIKSGGEGGTMYYNQCNYSNVGYDNPNTQKYETIATSGCGVCAACMVFNTLIGKELYTVKTMADFAVKNKARDNSGTNMTTLLKALCKAQPNYSYKTTNDINAVVNHLKNGGMAILNQGDVYNVFSTSGHFVVADKMVGNNINILDPYMYGGKYASTPRRNRIVKATEYGCVVSPTQAAKACSDRNPAYFLITYTAPKKASKPNYNAGSKYKLTACVNVWDSPSTTTGRIKKVSECTADGRAHCTSSNPNANATFKEGTVFSCLDVFEDKKTGYIWTQCPSGWLPVYYKEKKRANWYNK